MIIYLDVHDTLADTFEAVKKFTRRTKLAYVPGDHLWSKFFGEGIQEKIEARSAEWWANLPRTPEANAIVEMAVEYAGLGNVRIATKLSTPACAAGTMAWVATNYPFLRSEIHMCFKKQHLATPRAVLIDDSAHNCEDFVRNGGYAIITPRYWNRAYVYADSCVEYIENNLKEIKHA